MDSKNASRQSPAQWFAQRELARLKGGDSALGRAFGGLAGVVLELLASGAAEATIAWRSGGFELAKLGASHGDRLSLSREELDAALWSWGYPRAEERARFKSGWTSALMARAQAGYVYAELTVNASARSVELLEFESVGLKASVRLNEPMVMALMEKEIIIAQGPGSVAQGEGAACLRL